MNNIQYHKKEIKYYRKIKRWNASEETDYNSTIKDDSTIHVILPVDSEFQTSFWKPNKIITNQIGESIYEHPDLGLNKLESWDCETAISKYLGLEDTEASGAYDGSNNKLRSLVVHLVMFWSPTDVLSKFYDTEVKKKILESVRQDRRLRSDEEYGRPIYTGLKVFDKDKFERVLYIQIHDISALFGKLSLNDLSLVVGVIMQDKELISKAEKGQMLKTYQERFDDFIKYAKGDSTVLMEILDRFSQLFEKVCKDLSIPEIDLGYTVGSNVSKIVENILITKMGKLATLPEPYIVGRVNGIVRHYKNRLYSDDTLRIINDYKSLMYSLGYESTYNYLWAQKEDTKQRLALLDGGRCRNERVLDVSANGVLVDLDISGCYANGLIQQTYPIGLPTILDVKNQYLENRMTLGELLKSNIFKDLVPGLWFARISTKIPANTKENDSCHLSFAQDLIISKLMPKVTKTNTSDDETIEESKAYHGDFILLTKEIYNGALTHDILQTLKSCASDKEWKELKEKVFIDAIIFYPKSFECKTLEEYTEKTQTKDEGIKTIVGTDYSVTTNDNRSRYWLGIPMGEGWMSSLLALRKQYPKGSPENAVYKLICNSTYGVIASHFFSCSNTCVANNITARARSLSWLMSKGLGSFHSITDGGIFHINAVNTWKKQPGINTLTFINERKNLSKKVKENVKQIGLDNKEWTIEKAKENKEQIAQLAYKHLKILFEGIDILEKDQFSFEVKGIHTVASYHAQANYLSLSDDGSKVIRARGYELEKTLYKDKYGTEIYNNQSPVIDALEHIKDDTNIPAYPPLYKGAVLKVNEYQNTPKKYDDHGVLPGDSITRRTWFRPISLSMFRWQTLKQYKGWKSKHDGTKKHKGYGVELGWMATDGSIPYREAVTHIQGEIDKGDRWTSKEPSEGARHPYAPDTVQDYDGDEDVLDLVE